ncbi:ubiquitin-conjugating enzyme E2 Z-like [Dermacentor albipictus]|uniref:ubiquitin-conjugating enzyme E2 Z-like n=1 Tax=Dermacentor albipictus TaxID=60249 RepID=UPI0031FE0513
MITSNWDPLEYQHEVPTPQCLVRVKKDIAEFNAQPPARLFISPDEDDITKVHVLMLGAPGSPYEGGFFQFLLKFPQDYPLRPPRVRFLNTDGGRLRFHIHLYINGKVCVSTLGTGGGLCNWSPAQSLSSTLVSIQSLLSDNPYYDAFSQEKAPGDAEAYNVYIQHETLRVAVCDQVDAALREDAQCPPALRKVILESFLESYNKYEETVNARLHQTGTTLRDPLMNATKTAQYETLLTRLQSLKDESQKKKEAEAAAAAAAEAAAAAAAVVATDVNENL